MCSVKEKGKEDILEIIMAENFPKWWTPTTGPESSKNTKQNKYQNNDT